MNPVAWDAVIILTPQVTRLIGITEEITDKLLEVRVDMEPIFRIVINEDNSKQKEQFMRISDMLYYQKLGVSGLVGYRCDKLYSHAWRVGSHSLSDGSSMVSCLVCAPSPQGVAEHRFDYWKDFPEIEKDGAGSQPDRFF